jgi:YbbR domain-containing protein
VPERDQRDGLTFGPAGVRLPTLGGLWAASISNPWTKLISLLLALTTWLYVQGEEIREERVKAQIAWTLPSDLVATEALPTSAQITVRGTRAAVNKAHQAPVRVVVDAANLSKGEHEVDLGSIQPHGLPPSVEQLAISPSGVRFVLDKVAVHSVRIQPVLVGEVGPGHAIARVTSDPQVVEVRGPTDAVSSLREVSTRPIDVSGLTDSLEREIDLDLPRGVELAGSPSIRATVTVVSSTERRQLEGVPVYLWPGHEGWRVEPDRITVVLEGPVDELRTVRSDQVAAFVHLPDGADAAPLQQVEVWYGPKAGPRIEVLQPGGSISAVATSPPSLTAVQGAR